ncbi:MAG: hypothetical protein M1828_004038 [Chrysothrix sp. TS-e1954]|nr:MAG: hypothetical protein M1828_004038 [Chrysothrix sp. TS-e1954]
MPSPHVIEFSHMSICFFDYIHAILPTIHRQTFDRRLHDHTPAASGSPLLYIIMALGTLTSDVNFRQGKIDMIDQWADKAKQLLDKRLGTRVEVEETLQAAVYIVLYDYMQANMLDMWMNLGKVLRFVSFLGLDRMDAPSSWISTFTPPARNHQDRETRRKAIWALNFLDKYLPCLTGYSPSLVDATFKVNYPIEDEEFQKSDFVQPLKPFTAELPHTHKKEIEYTSEAQDERESDPLIICFRASVILQRIIQLNNSVHNIEHKDIEETKQERESERMRCMHALHHFDYSLYKQGNSIRADDRPKQHVLAHAVLSISWILLWQPHTQSISAPDRGAKFSLETAVKRATSTQFFLEDAGAACPSALENPLLAPAIYGAIHVSILGQYLEEEQSTECKYQVQELLDILEDASEFWKPAAMKFRAGILHTLEKDAAEIDRNPRQYLAQVCTF